MDEQLDQSGRPEEQMVPDNPMEETLVEPIVWQAEEFEIHQRSWIWYLVTTIVFAVLLIYTIYTRQWLLVAIVVVIGLILYLSNRIKPRLMQYRIDEQGLHINDRTFTFDQLKNFWFYDKAGRSYLSAISTFRLMPVITVQIDPELKSSIRTTLSKAVPESGRKDEDLVDKINRFLKV